MEEEALPGGRWLRDDREYLYEEYDIERRYDYPDAYEQGLYGEAKYPLDWVERGKAISDHYGWECGRCGRHVAERELVSHVHHAEHLSDGGTNELDNLVLLCKPCHAVIHPDNVDRDPSDAPMFPAREADPRVAVEREPKSDAEWYWYSQQDGGPDRGNRYNRASLSPVTTEAAAATAVRKENPTPTDLEGCEQELEAEREERRRRGWQDLEEEKSEPNRNATGSVTSRPDVERARTEYPRPLAPGVPPPETVPDPEAADSDHERGRRELERARRARVRGATAGSADAASDRDLSFPSSTVVEGAVLAAFAVPVLGVAAAASWLVSGPVGTVLGTGMLVIGWVLLGYLAVDMNGAGPPASVAGAVGRLAFAAAVVVTGVGTVTATGPGPVGAGLAFLTAIVVMQASIGLVGESGRCRRAIWIAGTVPSALALLDAVAPIPVRALLPAGVAWTVPVPAAALAIPAGLALLAAVASRIESRSIHRR